MKIIYPRNRKKEHPLVVIYKARNNKNIYINSSAVELLKLKKDEHILFGQDEEDETIFYILKCTKGEGFKLREQSNGGKSLMIHSSDFEQLIKDTFNFESKLELLVSSKPTIKKGIKANMLIQYNSIDE